MAQAGFILTRHWRDTPQGTEVSFWLATDNGPLQVTLAPQESVAFIPADQVPRAQHILQGEQGFRLTPLALKDFHRQPVYGLYCRAHRQLMNYEKRLREGGVTVYEADVRPPERYLMDEIVEPLKQEINAIRKELGKLRRAVEKSNSCRFATNCPVRDELQKPEKTGENHLPRQPVQRKRIRSDTAAGTSEHCKNSVSGRDTEIDTGRNRL